MPRPPALLSCVLAMLAVGAAPCLAAELAPLYVVPTDDRLLAPLPDEQALRVEFEAVNRDRLLAALGPGAAAVGASSVRYDVGRVTVRPFVPDTTGRWLASSFIVDHDEPELLALRDEFSAASPVDPAQRVPALVRFVDDKLEPRLGQGWEPASLTARTLRGDCTEHAVLTAAIARSIGIPARVVIGMVIVRPGDRYATVGHAWAELRDGDQWVIADAALGAAATKARYVPLGLLEDEGPGFLLQMIDTLDAWATRVVVTGPAE